MGAVVIVAIVLAWAIERRARFRRLSAAHMSRAIEESGPDPYQIAIRIPSPREAWHMELSAKYEKAARHPWLPVDSDPPEPE
jgi:hypothetical protein